MKFPAGLGGRGGGLAWKFFKSHTWAWAQKFRKQFLSGLHLYKISWQGDGGFTPISDTHILTISVAWNNQIFYNSQNLSEVHVLLQKWILTPRQGSLLNHTTPFKTWTILVEGRKTTLASEVCNAQQPQIIVLSTANRWLMRQPHLIQYVWTRPISIEWNFHKREQHKGSIKYSLSIYNRLSLLLQKLCVCFFISSGFESVIGHWSVTPPPVQIQIRMQRMCQWVAHALLDYFNFKHLQLPRVSSQGQENTWSFLFLRCNVGLN